MYETFYGLQESPFNLTPDSRFLFLSDQHRAAMAALLYGIEQRKGFICLTGEIGSGKTTLCRALINQLKSRQIRIGVILNSYLSDIELLRNINDEFGLESHFDSKKDLIDILNGYLINENRRGHIVALIIDEAQNLPPATLEQIRMLGNLESETMKLFQIVLVGQPELADILARPDLEQLEQRVSVRFHLQALNEEETLHYIRHRLLVAGSRAHIDFSTGALEKIRQATHGIPRRINVLCDRCLLIGFVAETFTIDENMVEQAIQEISAKPKPKEEPVPVATSRPWAIAFTLAAAMAVLAGVLWLTIYSGGSNPLSAQPQIIEIEPPDLEPPSTLPLRDTVEQELSLIPQTELEALATSPTLTASASQPTTAPQEEEIEIPAPLDLEALAAAEIDLEMEEVEEEFVEEKKPTVTPLPPPVFETPQPVEPTPTPQTSVMREVEGVLLSSAPPTSAPASAPAPTAKDSWTYDGDGIVRVGNAGLSQLASVLTIARRWDARANLSTFRNQSYEENMAIDPLAYAPTSLDLHVLDLGDDFAKALKLNLPVLIETRDDPKLSSHCALISLYGDQCTLADPLHGLVRISESAMPMKVKHVWVIYRDADRLLNIAQGTQGATVEKIQRYLSKQGVLKTAPDEIFGPKMAESLKAFQRKQGLSESGVIDEATAIAILSGIAPAEVRLRK